MMLYNIWNTHKHTTMTAYWRTAVCSECTFNFLQLRQDLFNTPVDMRAGTGSPLSVATGQLIGMCQGWNGHGLEDVWPALLIFLSFFFFLFFFLKSQKIIQRYMHKRVNVIGRATAHSRCNKCVYQDGRWTDVNKMHLAFKRKKKSILLVLPDILMFNMRVLYYHDDYDYSCAILVYCCLNVTLFFYDMTR